MKKLVIFTAAMLFVGSAMASDAYHFNVEEFKADIETALKDARKEMDQRYPDLAKRFTLTAEEIRAITPTATGKK